MFSGGMTTKAATSYPSNYMYTVQSGDYLYMIASKHGITVSDILWYNAITNPNMIFVGQRIFIPAEWLILSDKIIVEGVKYLGTPYQYAAAIGQTSAFDCSSFVHYIYGSQGITLARTSREQSLMGKAISRNDLRKGDLVFFYNESRENNTGIDRIGHVAMYIGNDRLIHATTSRGVMITNFEGNSYWSTHYVTSRRILE